MLYIIKIVKILCFYTILSYSESDSQSYQILKTTEISSKYGKMYNIFILYDRLEN